MQFRFILKDKIRHLPESSGIYFFSDGKNILYIGKAVNIQERVENHFQQFTPYRTCSGAGPTYRDNLFINRAAKIGYIKTDSEIEALILEANLIKKYQPKYNVVWKDDKNYFYVVITKEDFPQVFWTHQTKLKAKPCTLNPIYVGPFVDGASLKQTLKVLRKVFPYRTCKTLPKRPCLWYQLARCPAPCLLKSSLMEQIGRNQISTIQKESQKNIKNLIKILKGKKARVLKNLKREMRAASNFQEFEKAAKKRDQIVALEKVLSHAKVFDWSESQYVIKMPWHKYYLWRKIEKKLKRILNLKLKKSISRIEAYDVSNIQGKEATGAMVTFIAGQPAKNFYRKFKIKTVGEPNDVAMLKEVLSRRFKHLEWPYPDLILVDGGKAQLNATINSLNQHKSARSASISVLALAKKENKLFIESQKKPIRLNSLPDSLKFVILRLRDEAHRFAISYHKKLRQESLLQK